MIVPMKKITLTILKEDQSDMLESLQKGAHIMFIDEEGAITEQGVEKTSAEIQNSESMLRLLNNYSKKPGFFENKPSVTYSEFSQKTNKGEDLLNQIESIDSKLQGHNSTIASLEAENSQLRPWIGIGAPLKDLKSSKSVFIQPGFLQPETQEEIINYLRVNGQDIQILETVPEGIACVVYLYKKGYEEYLNYIKDLGFTETTVPQTQEDPLVIIRNNNKKIEQERVGIKECKEELSKYGTSREDLELFIQQEESKKRRLQAPYISTIQTATYQGWARSDRIEELKQDINSVTDIYDLEITDPEKDEIPPTVTKNNYFLAQFETITDSFSLPKFNSLDPAPVAGPWYWIIYGMMMGDAGYGAVMTIALFIFRKLKKPQGEFGKLVNVLYYSSYTTIFWGILFGSYFGETFHPILFNPLEAPIYMLIFSLIIGVLQLFSGMILKMVLDYKEGHFIDGIYDQLSWMVLITGIGFYFIASLRTIAIVMIVIGALTILFTAGRDKPSFFGKILGGLLGLYDITSYLSDVLSYSRILALGLATSVVGMVMNMLAGMLATNFFGYIFAALVFLVGHVFNIVLSMLSAYVHDSRLQYIEFFNKFYDGGGIPFKPIEIDQRYIDVIGADLSQGSNAVKGDLQ